jgi:hypothetical protein
MLRTAFLDLYRMLACSLSCCAQKTVQQDETAGQVDFSANFAANAPPPRPDHFPGGVAAAGMALLDGGALSVPFEVLKRVTRNRKYDIEAAEEILRSIETDAGSQGSPSSPAAVATREQAIERLAQHEDALQRLKASVRRTALLQVPLACS